MGFIIGGLLQRIRQSHHGLTHKVLHFFHRHVLRPEVHVYGIPVFFVPEGEGHGFCRTFLYIAIICTPADGCGNFVFIRGNGNGNLRIGHGLV